MDFTTPVPERSGTPAQRGGPSTPQAGMASVDASSPLVGTDARKAKQAERLASRARVRSSIRRDLSGKDSSVPPVGSQQDAEQPAAEEDIEEGIPASTIKFGAAKLFNENVPEMSKDTEVLDIVYQMMPDGIVGDLMTGSDSNLEVIMRACYNSEVLNLAEYRDILGAFQSPQSMSQKDLEECIKQVVIQATTAMLFNEVCPYIDHATKAIASKYIEESVYFQIRDDVATSHCTQLEEDFKLCIAKMIKCMKSLNDIKIARDNIRDESIQVTEARSLLDPNSSTFIEDLTEANSKQDSFTTKWNQCETARRLVTDDLIGYAMTFCNRPVPTSTIKMITKPLALKEKYWTETENAAYARELFIIMMDFLVQDPGNHYMLLPIVHLICNMQLHDDKLILPPNSISLCTGPAIEFDPDMLELYMIQNKVLYETMNRLFPNMIRKLRSKRDFECTKGESITVKVEQDDGVMAFFQLYMIHADRSSTYRIDLRNKIEHSPALFIAGNITKTVDRLVPICEEAMRFKVTADYDVSVKAIATILVKRSTFFQPLMAKYVMDVQSTQRADVPTSLMSLLMEVESIVRESHISSNQQAAVISDAKRLTAQANLVFDDGTDSPTSEGADEIEMSSNPEVAKKQIAALAKIVTHCQNKACTAKISDKRIKWQKEQIEKGEKSFANGQLDANTNVLCYNCYDKLKKGGKVFKEDGTECKIKSKGTGRLARASIAKAKADKAVRHDEILQSLMDELEAENNPTKTEFETISPADLIKMCKEDKKQYLDKYLKWYATDASSEKATAGSASVSLNC